MRQPQSTFPGRSLTRPDDTLPDVGRLAAEARRRLNRGEVPNVAGLVAAHPELKRHRSLVLDLAYEEYRHRQRQGDAIDAERFAEQFPSFSRSLYMLIAVQDLLGDDDDLQPWEDLVEWPEPDGQFLGFCLRGELGRGTFARVYLATEPALGNRLVTVKVSPRGGGEAAILGKLRHAGIVPVHSVQEDAATGLTAVCMPYLGRATLADLADRLAFQRQTPRTAAVILDVVREAVGADAVTAPFHPLLVRGSYVDVITLYGAELAAALAHAHACGILHRDLKPSNVLLANDARPLLLDFNLSEDAAIENTRCGGTLPYMAPEQLALVAAPSPAPPLRSDPRSDVFSLGVILYELLAGRLPWAGFAQEQSVAAAAEQLRAAQGRGPPSLAAANPAIDGRLAAVIEQALAFSPADRPPSAAALADALRGRLSFTARVQRSIRSRPYRALAMALFFLAVLVAAAVAIGSRAPYDARQYSRGLAYAAAGAHTQALECFDKTLRVDRQHREALIARAKSHEALGDFQAAFEDFNAAHVLLPAAELSAAKGYCLSRLKFHDQAVVCLEDAVARGFASAAVHNDLGFSYLKMNRLDEAQDALERAVAKDDSLAPAYRNLLRAYRNRANLRGPLPADAARHARRAMQIGPVTAELCGDAALVAAICAADDPAKTDAAAEYLRRGAACGLDLRTAFANPHLAPLAGRPDLASLESSPSPGAPAAPVDFLIDPLE